MEWRRRRGYPTQKPVLWMGLDKSGDRVQGLSQDHAVGSRLRPMIARQRVSYAGTPPVRERTRRICRNCSWLSRSAGSRSGA